MNNDLISREALIEAVEDMYEYAELGEVLDVIKQAPTVEARIDPNDILYLCDHKSCGENYNCYECNHTSDIRHAVNFDLVEFPRSVFFERPRPHGKWLHPYEINIACECSNCRMQMPITDYFNFCPNCGAEMEVSNDG